MSVKEQKIISLQEKLDKQSKELYLYYNIDKILNDFESSLADIFQKLVNIIPNGFRFSEICTAQIISDNQEITSKNFKKTELKLSSNIQDKNVKLGEINVFYIKNVRSDKGIFIENEKKLLKTISEKISNYLVFRKLKQTIQNISSSNKKKEVDSEIEKTYNWLSSLHLNNEEIESITKVKIAFNKGEIICKQGAITSYIMLLTSGLTKNYLEGITQRGFNFKIIKPFDFIGLSSLYGSNIYQFSGSAITKSTIYHIETGLLKEIIANNQMFAHEINKWYCRITEWHLNRLSCIANKQSHGKIADVLLYLWEDVFEGEIIQSKITRKDIAELAAMSTESAVRILSELKKDRIIKILSNGIEISNPKLLKTISATG